MGSFFIGGFMKNVIDSIAVEWIKDLLIGASNAFRECAEEDLERYLEALDNYEFESEYAYLIAALLCLDSKDIAGACEELEKAFGTVEASASAKELYPMNDDRTFTPKEMVQEVKDTLHIRITSFQINKALCELGYQKKVSAKVYNPTPKAHRQNAYAYELVSKHSTLKWKAFLIPAIIGAISCSTMS